MKLLPTIPHSLFNLIGCDHSLTIWLWGHIYIFSPLQALTNTHEHLAKPTPSEHEQKYFFFYFQFDYENEKKYFVNENLSNGGESSSIMNEKLENMKNL